MFQREPVIILLAGLGAIVLAVLGALVSLDVLAWSPDQVAKVVGAVTAVTGVLIAMLRAVVVSPATDAERTEAAVRADLPTELLEAGPLLDPDELATKIAAALARDAA